MNDKAVKSGTDILEVVHEGDQWVKQVPTRLKIARVQPLQEKPNCGGLYYCCLCEASRKAEGNFFFQMDICILTNEIGFITVGKLSLALL